MVGLAATNRDSTHPTARSRVRLGARSEIVLSAFQDLSSNLIGPLVNLVLQHDPHAEAPEDLSRLPEHRRSLFSNEDQSREIKFTMSTLDVLESERCRHHVLLLAPLARTDEREDLGGNERLAIGDRQGEWVVRDCPGDLEITLDESSRPFPSALEKRQAGSVEGAVSSCTGV